MNKTMLETVVKNYSRNILYVCERCTVLYINEGKTWYANTYFICKELANKYLVPFNSVVGVLAALSPGIRWNQNLKVTEQLLDLYKSNVALENISSLGIYGKRNFVKAKRILQGEDPFQVLGGNKVRAFYNCISHMFSNEAPVVVLDRHAVSIAVGQPLRDGYVTYVSTPSRYNILANAYIQVAKSVGMLPYQLQAMVWCRWRDYYGTV